MKRVFESAECEAVRNSIFWELRYKKHENQVKGCSVKLRVSDLQNECVDLAGLWYCRSSYVPCTWRIVATEIWHSTQPREKTPCIT